MTDHWLESFCLSNICSNFIEDIRVTTTKKKYFIWKKLYLKIVNKCLFIDVTSLLGLKTLKLKCIFIIRVDGKPPIPFSFSFILSLFCLLSFWCLKPICFISRKRWEDSNYIIMWSKTTLISLLYGVSNCPGNMPKYYPDNMPKYYTTKYHYRNLHEA